MLQTIAFFPQVLFIIYVIQILAKMAGNASIYRTKMTTFANTVWENSLEKIVQVNQRLFIHLSFNVASLQKLISRNACMLALVGLRQLRQLNFLPLQFPFIGEKSCHAAELVLLLRVFFLWFACPILMRFRLSIHVALYTCKHLLKRLLL